MFIREMGIRNSSTVLNISIITVLKVLKSTTYNIKLQRTHYGCLEIDEFWTYAGRKKNEVVPAKVWLIYAYHRESET
jgi:hypothetical protein